MRKRTIAGALVLLMMLVVVVAGCGGGDPMETYKSDMKAWVDKYEADMTEKVAALESITDPLNATAEEIQGVKEFADLVETAVSELGGITAPEDLAEDHAAYVEGLEGLSGGFQVFAEAMESADIDKFQEAMGMMSSGASIEQAETALEEALGFQLSTD